MVEQHPGVVHALKQFRFSHLPEHLQAVSKPFHDLALAMVECGTGIELTVGLRKLLEAKDCAVRAALEKRETDREPSEEKTQGALDWVATKIQKVAQARRDLQNFVGNTKINQVQEEMERLAPRGDRSYQGPLPR